MGIVEVKCSYCGRGIYVKDNYVKDKMFCTLGCMDAYRNTTDKPSVI